MISVSTVLEAPNANTELLMLLEFRFIVIRDNAVKLLIFGCGYLGRRVAQTWCSVGHEVTAVTRSSERAAEFARLGIHPLLGDIVSAGQFPKLPAPDVVLFSVGYDRQLAGQVIQDVYAGGLRNTLAALREQGISPQRFIYISSTGVYGQAGGEWIDEESPCQPTREGGKACLAAEKILQESWCAGQAVVLRLAGIYGPGRIPRRQDLVDEKTIAAEPESFLNLIHVDDAAKIVTATAQVETSSRLYVVSDGHPVLRHDFYGELARLLGVAGPKYAPPISDTDDRRSRLSNKLVRNTRMVRELGVSLSFPTYREGLAAIVREDPQSA